MTILQLKFVQLTIWAKKIVLFSLFSRLLFAGRVTPLLYKHLVTLLPTENFTSLAKKF